MTPKPRSTYTDHTRKLRSDRRTAILNAAAARMGFTSWGGFGKEIRRVFETAPNDYHATENLRKLLLASAGGMPVGRPDDMPEDIMAVIEKYPPRKAGRPASLCYHNHFDIRGGRCICRKCGADVTITKSSPD